MEAVTTAKDAATSADPWMERNVLKAIVETDDSVAPAVQRFVLGAVMLPHGLQKTVGWFGGAGLEGTLSFFTETMGLPYGIALLVIVIESVGALALVLGVGARLAAIGTAAVMAGAIATVHAPHGFFMNWFGAQAGEGFEYHLLAIALAVSVAISGAGRWSVDRRLS